MKHSILYALSVSLVGYALLALSELAVTLLIGLATGYLPSLTYFTLPLLTFRVTEIHWTLVLFPPLAAACAMIVLSRSPLKREVIAGLGLSFPYLLVALMYVFVGAREFPLEVAVPLMGWAFLVGAASSTVVERFRFG